MQKRAGSVPIKFYKLMDILQRRGMSKTELIEAASISSVTMAKLGKGESVTTEIIGRICSTLGVQPREIMEYVKEE
jgi:DNA-binding Xre family transcriptional regulator